MTTTFAVEQVWTDGQGFVQIRNGTSNQLPDTARIPGVVHVTVVTENGREYTWTKQEET